MRKQAVPQKRGALEIRIVVPVGTRPVALGQRPSSRDLTRGHRPHSRSHITRKTMRKRKGGAWIQFDDGMKRERIRLILFASE